MFTPPVHAALEGETYARVSALNAERSGKRLSIQAFHLQPKIREVADLLRRSNDWRARVFEVHPKVSFATMNYGIAIAELKRRLEGYARRRELIARHFGAAAFMRKRNAIPVEQPPTTISPTPWSACITAERIARGVYATLPDLP